MPRKFKDITNQKFGRLTAIAAIGSGADKHICWLCKCECGNQTNVRGNSLRTKKTQSCGCLKKEKNRYPKYKNIMGKKFGRLIAIKREGTNWHQRTSIWLCRCECGKEIKTTTKLLTSGSKKSCGCLHKLPWGEGSFNQLYITKKSEAKKRKYEWQINKDQFRQLVQQSCYYCGNSPSQYFNRRGSNGKFAYNGLDRIDNNKGYTLNNIVPCCGKCNMAKFTMTVEDFKEWIMRVYNNFILKKDYLQSCGFKR